MKPTEPLNKAVLAGKPKKIIYFPIPSNWARQMGSLLPTVVMGLGLEVVGA